MRKVALFAFNAEFMCFIHVLLNALDMNATGMDVKIVIEGSATKLIPDLGLARQPHGLLIHKGERTRSHRRGLQDLLQ